MSEVAVTTRAATPMLETVGLEKHFRPSRLQMGKSRAVRAVDGIDLTVRRGETFGLVGESGCGKTTLGRLLVGLLQPTAGEVRLEGSTVYDRGGLPGREFRRAAQIVFQDPYASLNPVFRIETSLAEALHLRSDLKSKARRAEMEFLMERVGLRTEVLDQYPHQLSGGQRQRVVIARALATGARFLVLDEPVSALDVSVQSQILNLLIDLQQSLALTYVFISHDLGVIRYVCDRVAVMYLGKIVEIGSAQDVLGHPRHPYTYGLLSSIPEPHQRGARSRPILLGELPSPLNIPAGCRFHPRCPHAREQCRQAEPGLVDGAGAVHHAACFFPLP